MHIWPQGIQITFVSSDKQIVHSLLYSAYPATRLFSLSREEGAESP